jgi:CRISPR-associated protein Cas2
MARRHFLVTYDVSDDKRRTKLYKTLLGAGDHVQYSVFMCDLNEAELATLRGRVRPLIHHKEDQLLFVDLGLASQPLVEGIEALGRAYQPPVRVQVI